MKPISAPQPGRNRQWRLLRTPPREELIGAEHFDFVEDDVPEPGRGQVLLRTLCLGTSPAQRGYVSTKDSMHEKVLPGAVMRGRGVAQVLESKAARFRKGELVIAATGWQDFSVHDGEGDGILMVQKIHDPVWPLALSLGILGAAGLTAYFGLLEIGEAKPSDTVLVSAAAGGVGSCAVQIAKALGCRVVGIAGGPAKCAWVRALGADAAIDYKNSDLGAEIDKHCPGGVKVFFDNVGGDQLQQTLTRLARGARVVICGFIATDYTDPGLGPTNYTYLLRSRARMEGFFVFDFVDRFEEAQAELRTWYRAGQIADCNHIVFGLENMPDALRGLFTGANRGVQLCQVAEDPPAPT